MDAGVKVWKAVAFMDPIQSSCPYYMNEGVTTGIVVDGKQMVRMGDALFPLHDGWRSSKTEAKQTVVDELIRMAGRLQKAIDELKDEVLHETLATAEATP